MFERITERERRKWSRKRNFGSAFGEISLRKRNEQKTQITRNPFFVCVRCDRNRAIRFWIGFGA
jgi:hypothetical protein